MANDKQFRSSTNYVATRGVKEYRESIPEIVGPRDAVLELGCEWGTTTAILAAHGGRVIGTDVSPDCIERAREMHPQVEFEVLDAFDVRSAFELGQFDKVYMDLSGVSGYRSLLDLLALLNAYAVMLRPDTIVVKSGALKHLAAHAFAWPETPRARRRHEDLPESQDS